MNKKLIVALTVLAVLIVCAGALHFIVNYSDANGGLVDMLKAMHSK